MESGSTFRQAVLCDVEERAVQAAGLYEASLLERDTPVDAYINLAVLYWQSTGMGFLAGHGLTKEFVRHAGERYPEVLDEAARRYPGEPEVEFWQYYIAYYWGDPPFVGKCLRIVRHPSHPLVPYFYLFEAAGGNAYKEQAFRLLALYRQSLTAKNRYIVSVIEAVMLHRGIRPD